LKGKSPRFVVKIHTLVDIVQCWLPCWLVTWRLPPSALSTRKWHIIQYGFILSAFCDNLLHGSDVFRLLFFLSGRWWCCQEVRGSHFKHYLVHTCTNSVLEDGGSSGTTLLRLLLHHGRRGIPAGVCDLLWLSAAFSRLTSRVFFLICSSHC
jgi:hypothetical protein